jgi:hypothetical protein
LQVSNQSQPSWLLHDQRLVKLEQARAVPSHAGTQVQLQAPEHVAPSEMSLQTTEPRHLL